MMMVMRVLRAKRMKWCNPWRAASTSSSLMWKVCRRVQKMPAVGSFPFQTAPQPERLESVKRDADDFGHISNPT